jgi:hypothetical protein
MMSLIGIVLIICIAIIVGFGLFDDDDEEYP